MTTKFIHKLEQVIAQKQSHIALMITPQIIKMPLPMKRHDDPFLPFSKAIIRATQAITPVYVLDLAAYLRIGAAGAIALERTISYAVADSVLILHGSFAGAGYAEISDENAFGVDAVTLYNLEDAAAYLQRADRGAFVIDTAKQDMDPYPDGIGSLDFDAQVLRIRGSDGAMIKLDLFGEDAIYTSAAEDYAEQTRQFLEAQHND